MKMTKTIKVELFKEPMFELKLNNFEETQYGKKTVVVLDDISDFYLLKEALCDESDSGVGVYDGQRPSFGSLTLVVSCEEEEFAIPVVFFCEGSKSNRNTYTMQLKEEDLPLIHQRLCEDT